MNPEIRIGQCESGEITFKVAESMNRHIAIFGKSGSGKSVAGQKIIKSIVQGGGTVVAFDMHWLLDTENILPSIREEFLRMVHEIDVYKDGISCPLFLPFIFADGTVESSMDAVNAVSDVLSAAMNLKCRQRAELLRALRYVADEKIYAEVGIAALEEGLYLADSEIAANVHEKLRQILDYNVFHDGLGFIEDNHLNVIRLSKFAGATQTLITEILLSYIWRLANTGIFVEQGLYLFIDECQNIDFGKNSMTTTIMAEGRKFGVHLILITQSVNAGKGQMAHCMLQAGQQLFFAPASSDVMAIAKFIGGARFRDWQMILNTLKIGECVATGALAINQIPLKRPIKLRI